MVWQVGLGLIYWSGIGGLFRDWHRTDELVRDWPIGEGLALYWSKIDTYWHTD